jgi:hypothetical protein
MLGKDIDIAYIIDYQSYINLQGNKPVQQKGMNGKIKG